MRHWLQLGTRNWRSKPARTALTVLAVMLGAGVVVWVTGCYESVRRSVTRVVLDVIGRAHVVVEHEEGRWGLFSESFVNLVSELPPVLAVTTRTMEWVDGAVARSGVPDDQLTFRKLEVTGIDARHESTFRTHKLVDGHMPAVGERGVIAVEMGLASELGFGIGDSLRLKKSEPDFPTATFTVVGLVDRRRATAHQLPMLWAPVADVQELCRFPGRVKGLDIMLRDSSVASVRAAAAQITELAHLHRKKTGEGLKVNTTEMQLAKLNAAQGLLRFILMLCACVLLLTAFFIIAATMGMGVVERVNQIGLMRCVGVTRRQAAMIVLAESMPIGLAGVLLGVPLGFMLQVVTINAAREYIGSFAFSAWGIGLGVAGGLATALLGGLGPAWRALSVSPVEATRPLAKPRRWQPLAVCAAAGVAALAASMIVPRFVTEDSGGFDFVAVSAVILLYAGYALIAPAVVMWLGRPAIRVAAAALRLRPELLGDEVTRAPLRSAAVCCGLMVGLSLIVGLSVWGESVMAGWQFPKEFPEALMYSWNSVPLDRARAVRDGGFRGVKDMVIADDFSFSLRKPGIFNLAILDKFSRFVAVEPRQIPIIINLTYIEGDERDALARMERGGHLLITREFSQAQDKHLGDRVTLYVDGKPHEFTVAGVVGAPAVDVAVSFFNASEYFQIYAVGAVIGSAADAQEKFGRAWARMFLFNFDMPAVEQSAAAPEQLQLTPRGEEPGAASDAPASASVADPKKVDLSASKPVKRHPWFDMQSKAAVATRQQSAVVERLEIALGLEPGSCAFATASQLKRDIEKNLTSVLLFLSSIPFMGLIVAALGLGNLMSANVASRRREIGVLRALGMTAGQVLRMIIGEALILTLLGSAMGLLLGVHLGWMSNGLTTHLAGTTPSLTIPWGLVGLGAALAATLCLLAGAIPARMAARADIVRTLQSR